MAEETRQAHLLLNVLLWISIVLVALVVMPFAGSLFAAAVFATVLFPLQKRLSARFGDRPQLAAITLTIATSLVLILPVAGLTLVASQRIADVVDEVVDTLEYEGVEGLIVKLPENLRPIGRRFVKSLSPSENGDSETPPQGDQQPPSDQQPQADQQPQPDQKPEPVQKPEPDQKPEEGETEKDSGLGEVDSKTVVNTSAKVASAVLTWLVVFAIDVGLLIIAMYFLLAQGKVLVLWIVDTVPLSKQQSRRFIDEFHDVTVAVFGSTVASALLQTIIAAVGYLIAGTPMLLMVVMLTLLAAFIPVVGGGTLVIIVGVLTLLGDSTGWGIFLIVWGLVPVAISDNLLKPLLARGQLGLPGSVLFFAMFGGLALMGPMGIIAGPLVISFFLVVLRALRSRIKPGGPVVTEAPT